MVKIFFGAENETSAEERVVNAVVEGDLPRLEALARSEGGSVLNIAYENEHPLLPMAVQFGHEHIIRWLLSDEGGRALGFTNVLGKNADGETALHLAAIIGILEYFTAIVEGCKEENGEREEMLNARTNVGNTVLHFAAKHRHEDLIQWLVSNEEGKGRSLGFKSESVTALENDSKSALHFAAYCCSEETIETLLSSCTAGERIKLFLAVDKNHGWTPLHFAALHRHLGAIRELLRWEEAKVMVDTRDNRGMTVLHRVVCKGADADSRREWIGYNFDGAPIESLHKALIRPDPATTIAFIDVNAGLEIPEEIKSAVAAVVAAEATDHRMPAAN